MNYEQLAEQRYPMPEAINFPLPDNQKRQLIGIVNRDREAFIEGMKAMNFQSRVDKWMNDCFGEDVAKNKAERNFRFIEESIELAQSCNASKEDVLKLVDYVFSRPKGEIKNEVGGVMVTLLALCSAYEISNDDCTKSEIDRITEPEMMAKIRKKWESKKIKDGPLPGECETFPFPPPSNHINPLDHESMK